MANTYRKVDDATLEITKPVPVIEPEKVQITLDEILKIRASIDISEAEYLNSVETQKAKYATEKEYWDTLATEARKLGIKTRADQN